MTNKDILNFIRRSQKEQKKKNDIRERLLSEGLSKRQVDNFLGFTYKTVMQDADILENIEKDIYYKTFLEGDSKNIYRRSYKNVVEENKRKEPVQKKKDKPNEGNLFPLFIFWLGIGAMFFSPFIGFMVIFIAAIAFVSAVNKEYSGGMHSDDRKIVRGVKNLGLIVWMFIALSFVALLFLLGG